MVETLNCLRVVARLGGNIFLSMRKHVFSRTIIHTTRVRPLKDKGDEADYEFRSNFSISDRKNLPENYKD